ncbi:HTH-like domain protein [Escherichia coli 6-537-08_S1_C1]|nr:HTH-like domain protein [Escherichia coli 6-537-08_S1_C1]KEM44186.1 HTH-like domain protein [Escherichia coli 6-537-08_S1_C1]
MSRAQLHVILRRTDDWMDGRRSRHTDDTDVLLRIHHVIGELPTYGYRRVWALLRRQAELDGMPAINAKRVYRIMRQNALLLERKPAVPPSKRAHTGRVAVKESNQRWCSGKRLVRTVLIFTESSDQLSRATDRVPGLPASPGYVQ